VKGYDIAVFESARLHDHS